MGSPRNQDDDGSGEEELALEELRQWIRKEGLAEAKSAMLSILRSDKASAAARASVINTMLRAAGAFEQPGPAQDDEERGDGWIRIDDIQDIETLDVLEKHLKRKVAVASFD